MFMSGNNGGRRNGGRDGSNRKPNKMEIFLLKKKDESLDELLKAIRRLNSWCRFFNLPFLVDAERVRDGEEFHWVANPDFDGAAHLNAPRFDIRNRLRNRHDFEHLVAAPPQKAVSTAPICSGPPPKKAKGDLADMSNLALLRRFHANAEAELVVKNQENNPFFRIPRLSFGPVPAAPAVLANQPVVVDPKKVL